MYVKQILIDYEVDKMLRLKKITREDVIAVKAKIQLMDDLNMVSPDVYDQVMAYIEMREEELE